MKICSAIINLFHLIPAAPQTLVKPLLEVVMKTERAMLIEVGLSTAMFPGPPLCCRKADSHSVLSEVPDLTAHPCRHCLRAAKALPLGKGCSWWVG